MPRSMVAGHAALDGCLQGLGLRNHLAAVAVRALVLVRHALPAAPLALLLHLHREPWGHLLVHRPHALAAARPALGRLSVLGASAAALGADAVAVDARAACGAVVQVLQRHLDLHLRVRTTLPTTAATKEHVEGASRAVRLLDSTLESLLPLQLPLCHHLQLLQQYH